MRIYSPAGQEKRFFILILHNFTEKHPKLRFLRLFGEGALPGGCFPNILAFVCGKTFCGDPVLYLSRRSHSEPPCTNPQSKGLSLTHKIQDI
jgi:hypothetical protein